LADFTYRRRSHSIEAVRWSGQKFDAAPQWICDAIRLGAGRGGVTRINNGLHVLVTRCGEQIVEVARPGDWLTCDSDGALGICKDAVFTTLYERAGAAATQPQPEEVMDMALCEAGHVVLRVGQLYRFKPVGDCKECAALAKAAREAYGSTGDAA
jgi:hypothetical protein